MRTARLMKKSAAWVLCLAMALSLFSGIISTGASVATVVTYVADEYENLYKEDYSTVITNAQKLSDGVKYTWEGFAWKGDEASSRIDIATRNVAYDGVELVTEDLVSEGGDTIGKDNIAFTYLEAIEVIETLLPGSASNGKHLFDVITRKTEMKMEAGKLYSAWVAITVPEDAKAGRYHTTLSLVAGEQTLATYDYYLNVYDMTQPELDSTVDLWMWPYNSIRYYSGMSTEEFWETDTASDQVSWEKLWNTRLDEKYFPALKSELELYAKAGGDAIFAQVNEKNRTNGDPYPSLIKWTRHADGSMSYDYTDFDKWVELNMECGIDKEIKCYDPGVFYCTMAYYDEAKGEVRTQSDNCGGKMWQRFWGDFFEDFVKHLDEKGWFDITYITLDEKDYNITKSVIDLVKQYKNKDGKSLKISTAVATYQCEELFDEIADLSLAYGLSNGHMLRVIEDRNAKGLITTIYTCGPQGSSILNSPDESAMSIHDCYRQNDAGFLRWALQKYTADPLADSYNYNEGLCAGDMYLIYPDYLDGDMQAQSSPRYEKLCEALRDVEKAQYLEANMPETKFDLHNALMINKGAEEFRDIIGDYSAIYAQGLAPAFAFDEEEFTVERGATVSSPLTDDAEYVIGQQAAVRYIDDWDFTYSENNWTGEGHYFKLFFCSTNHYTSAAGATYEFDFYGDSFELIGTQGTSYGKSNVYVDGELVGVADQYNTNGGRFRTIFASDVLTLGDHHVKVETVGSGSKHVDYAIVKQSAQVEWTAADPSAVTFTADGSFQVHGDTVVMARCGDVKATATVKTAPDAVKLKETYDEVLMHFSGDATPELTAALAQTQEILDNADATAEQITQAYETLVSARDGAVQDVQLFATPIKSVYTVGEDVSPAGAVLLVKFKDGLNTLIPVELGMTDCMAVNTSVAGEHTVTVTCFGKQVTYTVTVNEPVDGAATFTDVPAGKWYESAVNYAVGHGLFNGISATTFEPDTPMSRGMLVTVLYRMEGSPKVSAQNTFTDVETGRYYTNAVLWASLNGIVNGMSEGIFAPGNNITREQLATILYRYTVGRGLRVSSTDISTFPDGGEVSKFAKDAMSWAVAEGLITGTKAGDEVLLNPQGNATRAQVATILMRYQELYTNMDK